MNTKVFKIVLVCLVLAFSNTTKAQTTTSKFIVLDKSFDTKNDLSMRHFLDSVKLVYDHKFGQKIAETKQVLDKEPPQNLLSNYLVDAIFEIGNTKLLQADGKKADLALLNFGGIRALISKGDITLGDIFSVLPFDNNYIVLLDIKGSELRKVFEKNLAELKNVQCFANVKLTYRNGIIETVLVDNQPIDNDRTYRMITINFIETGGDRILNDIVTKNVYTDDTPYRDHIIDYFTEKKLIETKLDDRVVIY